MGGLSLWHWIIVGVIVLVLFGGRGKISDIMGDFAKGIKSFKKGLAEDETPEAQTPAVPAAPVQAVRAEAPVVIAHQSEVAVPVAPVAKPRAKAAAKTTTAAKTTAKSSTAKAATAKAPAAKAPAAKKAAAPKAAAAKAAKPKASAAKTTTSRKKADS